MELTEFDGIWRIMAERKIEMDPESSNTDLLCIICNRLMIDACQGACGCRYCYKCIKDYLEGGNHHCPGGKVVCNEEQLVFERDVFRTVRINITISRIKVLCPNEACQLKMELNEMEEHLRLCTKQTMQCPYVPLGCDSKEDVKDAILSHLNNGTLIHVQLLMEWVHNLKNEVDGLKDYVAKNKLEISSLKEESKLKDIQIAKMMDMIADQRQEMQENMTKQKVDLIEEVIVEKKEIFEKMIETKIEMDNIRLISSSKENEIEQQKEELNIIRKEGKMERENVAMVVNSIKKFVNEIKEEKESSDTYKDRTMLKWNKLCASADADIIWRLKGYSQKKGTQIRSKPFYSNNYKFCLRIHIHYDNIGLYCHIVNGDNDDNLQWPMKRGVTLNIIDQDTLKIHKSYTFKCDSYKGDKTVFDRPKNELLGGIGDRFPLPKNPLSIIANDSIIVSCVIDDSH